MEYTDVNLDGVRGDTIADYLISIEATFSIVDRGRVIYQEPYFPVVELAQALVKWIARDDRVSFEFESASADASGIVTIDGAGDDWIVFSAFTPESRSSPMPWDEVEECVRDFVGDVRADLVAHHLDADIILGL